MTHERTPTSQALHQWGKSVVPVDEQRKEARRRRTLACIEREISGPAVHRTRRWRGAALAAALVAAIAGAVVIMPGFVARDGGAVEPMLQVVITQTGGTVVVTRAGRASLAATAQPLVEGDELATATGSGALLSLPGWGLSGWGQLPGTVAVGARSELCLDEVSELGQRLRLGAGRIDVSLDGAGPGRSLVVATPHADIAVVGTRFSVEVESAAGRAVRTRVSVGRGVVRVLRSGTASVFVHAGQTWSSDEPRDAGDTAAPLGSGPAGGGASDRASPGARAALGAEPAGEVAAGEPSGPTQGSDDAQARGREAEAATQALARRGTLAEENRLFRAALDARNEGDDGRAVAVLDELLSRYPGTPLAQEAEVERFRALDRLGMRADAARAARRYLAEHGAGFAREEARRLVLPPPAASSEGEGDGGGR